MPQYFVPPENISGSEVVISGSEAHHLVRVMRKKKGDEISLFDGTGKQYRARIEKTGADTLIAKIVGVVEKIQATINLTMFLPLIAHNKFEDILEKGTEIGLRRFIPITTARTQVLVHPDRLERQLKRWNEIVLAALKQSGRGQLVQVEAPQSFKQALARLKAGETTLIAWEKQGNRDFHQQWKNIPQKDKTSVNLFIGPEGGFEERELQAAVDAGAVSFGLGDGILRTETAALVCAALILYGEGAV